MEETNLKKKRIDLIFIDVDGVLVDCSRRLKYQISGDYDKFYSEEEMKKDYPLYANVNVIKAILHSYLQNADGGESTVYPVILTGRPIRTSAITIKTVEALLDGYSNYIKQYFFRRNHDYRPSHVVKSENVQMLLDSFKDVNSEYDAFDLTIQILDDDPSNVEEVERVCLESFPGVEVCSLVVGTKRIH